MHHLERLGILTALAAALAGPKIPGQTRLTGQVVDGDLKPIEGVSLRTFDTPRFATQETLRDPQAKTDARGRFSFQIADSRVPRVLVCAKRGRVTMCRSIRNATAIPTIVMGRSAPLTGKVIDRAGKPIVDAWVEAREQHEGSKPSVFESLEKAGVAAMRSTARTNERGVFQLKGTYPTGNALRVEHEGYQSRRLLSVSISDPLTVTLEPAPHYRGRLLLPDGAPAAGALVRCGDRQTTASVDGRFEIHAGETRRVELVATRGRGKTRLAYRLWEPSTTEPIVATLRPDTATNPAVTIVRAADQTPIRDFEILVHQGPRNQIPKLDALLLGGGQYTRIAAKNGLARLPRVRRGEVTLLFARARGFGTRRRVLARTSSPAPVELRLFPEATVEGTVLDSDGKPAAGVAVWAAKMTDNDLEALRDTPHEHSLRIFARSPLAVTTGANGKFHLTGLPAGRMRVFLYRPRSGFVEPHPVILRPGQPLRDVALRLPTLPRLQGEIPNLPAGMHGLALEFRPRRIHRWWHRPELPLTATVPVRHDGSFVVPSLRPDTYLARLIVPVRPQQGVPLRIGMGNIEIAQTSAKIQVPLDDCLPGELRGRVKTNAPFGRLAVLVTEKDDPERHRVAYHYSGPVAPLGGDYRFRVRSSPGTKIVALIDRLTGLSLTKSEVSVPAGRTIQVELAYRQHAVEVIFTEPPTRDDGRLWLEVRPELKHWLFPVQYLRTGEDGSNLGFDILPPFDSVQLLFPSGHAALWLRKGAQHPMVLSKTLVRARQERVTRVRLPLSPR